MKKAKEAGIGIVAMKAASGGPLAAPGETRASYREALKWIMKRPYVQTTATAMGNFDEIEENFGAMGA
jgi:hypothetical protein